MHGRLLPKTKRRKESLAGHLASAITIILHTLSFVAKRNVGRGSINIDQIAASLSGLASNQACP